MFSKCACGNSIYFVPVCTSTYRMEQSKTLILNVSAEAHTQLSNLQHAKTHLKVPNGRNSYTIARYIKKLLLMINLGVCHKWSRSRHLSLSLPGDRYLKLSSQIDHRAEISGNIVWYDARALRPEVLLSLQYSLQMRSFLIAEFLTTCVSFIQCRYVYCQHRGGSGVNEKPL